MCSDPDREDLQCRLRLAENQADDLAKNLKEATSKVEQYRVMVQSLEESLDREKEVEGGKKAACLCYRVILLTVADCFFFFFLNLFLFDQVTEQLQASIESRTTEAKKSYLSLEEKLMKAAIEKQELEEQNKRAQISFDEQVLLINFNIFSGNDSIICFYDAIKNAALHRWTV